MKKAPIKLLKSIKILSTLTEDALNVLYAHMNEEKYLQGQTLFNEGDMGDVMYIILTGSVAITVDTPDGEVLEIAEIKAGNFFGEMSIFDKVARSATCTPKVDTTLLTLKADDFYRFIEENPANGINIMHAMLQTTTGRLKNTGAFLSDMVTWGEQARVRAITDDFTGLYNRRFLDEAIEERLAEAKSKGEPLSVVMIDLDNFGTLNNLYGQNMGDKALLEVIPIYRKLFRNEDVLARYGGDEFTFLLPCTTGEKALDLCSELVLELREIELLENLGGSLKKVTASIGVSCYPDHSDSVSGLKELADKALYRAKEAGRDTAKLWKPQSQEPVMKTHITSIKKRNTIVANILKVIVERDSFLVMGHKNPDEDCISSMIAMCLILNKFSKTIYLMIPDKINENYQYLLNICRYNSIRILKNTGAIPSYVSTIFIMDTPKPEMKEIFPGSDELFEQDDIIKIEIDHHLAADSGYIGDEGYCLVDEASSASELVGMLALKLYNREDLINEFNIQELLSRNFVLAVLTGIIGDSKMGKYLKTRREKWFYRLYSNMFSKMLSKKTRKDSSNFSTMDEVFKSLQQLSKQEDKCFQLMMKHKTELTEKIASIIIDKETMEHIAKSFDHETIITAARYATDILAETGGTLGLVIYFDDEEDSDLIQFRVRRNHAYKALDLRDILDAFSIKNGGGHPGAIGFRFPEGDISDLHSYVNTLATGIERMMENEESVNKTV